MQSSRVGQMESEQAAIPPVHRTVSATCRVCGWTGWSATDAGARLLADHHVSRHGTRHQPVITPDPQPQRR